MLESVEWGKYRLGDLFTSENGDTDIQKADLTPEGNYVVTAGLSNYGVLGRSAVKAKVFEEGTITIDMFGNAFYRHFPYKMVTHARVFSLKPLVPFTTSQGLFVVNALSFLTSKFGYENMCSWAKIKEEKIQLPTHKGKINMGFIEQFIWKLNAARLSELNAYLSAAKLKDYTLTPEEAEVLEAFEQGRVSWREYNVQSLFGKSTRGKRLKSADRIPGKLPFVTAGEAETGVSAFIGNVVEVFPANTITIDMFGSAKYRNYAYGADDHVAVVHTQQLLPHAVCFVTAAVHKAAYTGKFDYGRNFYAKDADELNIMLWTENEEPAYHKMACLISAVQKLVIKDVVRFTDRNIALTKEVLGH